MTHRERSAPRTLAAAACLALVAAACEGRQSALDPAGPQASRIGTLWWFMLAAATVVFVLVMAALAMGLTRRTRPPEDEGTQSRMTRHVAIATAATVVTLLVFTVVDFATGRSLATLQVSPKPLNIEVVGHQWWWEVHYDDPVAQHRVVTANEIHIPVGRPVVIRLTATDVIHSFWVPNLHGKRDLVPGHTVATWLRADEPGIYRGQCAEFCGYQHAKMALFVFADPPAKFDQWYGAQLQPAQPPLDSLEKKGQQVFLSGPCALCHAITGTPAGGQIGPDLTHLASRTTIAAGTLPNTPGNLGGWVVDPQGVKPGTHMPSNQLESSDLRALLAYLGTLK